MTTLDLLHTSNNLSPDQAATLRQWLWICCLMVLCMIVVGGVTRLTHSGLSIVEWAPIVGTLPPLSDQDWLRAFALYQRSPEYLQVNFGMTLEQFKPIFWWEWAHRLLGRLIGLSVLLPLLWFAWRGVLRGALLWRLFGIALLIGAQGAMGWYMVQSGLVDDPRVSQFRLTAHLSLAFVILGSLLWNALDLLPADQQSQGQSMSTGTRHLLRSVLGGSHIIRIEAHGEGLEAALSAVPGVTRVTHEGSGLRIEATGDIRGDIARAVVGAGGDLTMIDAGHASLDDVYARFFEGIPNAA
jgi:cytochrome c oxidase assembly protein subunit 15